MQAILIIVAIFYFILIYRVPGSIADERGESYREWAWDGIVWGPFIVFWLARKFTLSRSEKIAISIPISLFLVAFLMVGGSFLYDSYDYSRKYDFSKVWVAKMISNDAAKEFIRDEMEEIKGERILYIYFDENRSTKEEYDADLVSYKEAWVKDNYIENEAAFFSRINSEDRIHIFEVPEYELDRVSYRKGIIVLRYDKPYMAVATRIN
jgi:hypothetical protein